MSRKRATSKRDRKGKGQMLIRNILRNAVKEESRPETGLGTKIANMFRGIGLEEPIRELRGYTIDPPKFDE